MACDKKSGKILSSASGDPIESDRKAGKTGNVSGVVLINAEMLALSSRPSLPVRTDLTRDAMRMNLFQSEGTSSRVNWNQNDQINEAIFLHLNPRTRT